MAAVYAGPKAEYIEMSKLVDSFWSLDVKKAIMMNNIEMVKMKGNIFSCSILNINSDYNYKTIRK